MIAGDIVTFAASLAVSASSSSLCVCGTCGAHTAERDRERDLPHGIYKEMQRKWGKGQLMSSAGIRSVRDCRSADYRVKNVGKKDRMGSQGGGNLLREV